MLVDLVQTTTRDGVRLDGAYQAPAHPGAGGVAVDAFVLLHGTGGSFYSSALFGFLSERLLALGCGVLRANTRGHDLMSTAATSKGGRRQGAAYEVVDDCRHDVAAWMEWLSGAAGPRVGLLGHSLGAVKCLYAQAHEPIPRAACVVAVSPPRLSHAAFRSGPQAADFLDTFARAERLVAEREPDALLDVRIPLPFLITAAGYVEKYGPDERYNYLRFLDRVGPPTLLTFGAQEVATNVAFQRAPDDLASMAGRDKGLAVETVPGADHFYGTGRDILAQRIEAWLQAEVHEQRARKDCIA
jgi:hypothetical protein